MSPYLMQAPILGAIAAVCVFAAILLFCTITDAFANEADK